MSSLKITPIGLGRMGVNCLLLRDESGIGAVVDPGGDTEGAYSKYIADACRDAQIEIKYIILTHAHFDHMLSLELLRSLTGAPLAIHKDDAPALADPKVTYMRQFAGVTEPCKQAEILLCEGDTLALGDSTLTVLHTPGHTPGSICLVCDDQMITGDTLFRGTIGRHDLYGGDGDVLMHTLERFKQMDGDFTLYPGHGDVTTLSHELETNPFLV